MQESTNTGIKSSSEESLSELLGRIIKNTESIIKEIEICLARFRENTMNNQPK
jgi:hypothetical protein